MFKKILIPTDGSPLSCQAANAGVIFARSVGAEVVALHVTQPFAATIGFDGMAAAYAITDEDYEKAAAEQGAKYLKAVSDRADTAGVKVSTRAVSNFNVADGIVQAAADDGLGLHRHFLLAEQAQEDGVDGGMGADRQRARRVVARIAQGRVRARADIHEVEDISSGELPSYRAIEGCRVIDFQRAGSTIERNHPRIG